MIRVLGIETSCDETAASVVALADDGRPQILSNAVLSQIEEHAAFGGVVPEIAARAHVEALDGLIEAALADAGTTLADVDAVAATAGPGLVGGLIVGLMTAKAIAAAAGKPFVAVNHLEAHALTARLTDGVTFPYLALLVSGGHTQTPRGARRRRLCPPRQPPSTTRWAKPSTRPRRCSACPIPAGQRESAPQNAGNPARFALPLSAARPSRGLDFSFAGLKTAVRLAATAIAPLSEQDVADICASFQAAVTDALADRVSRALEWFRAEYPDAAGPALVVAGGVAANRLVRSTLEKLCADNGFGFVAPPLALCTDNAAMIAWAGIERLRAGLAQADGMYFSPRSRWPLDSVSAPVVGSGRRGAKA
jgi:N6-L-threonylcarbamoyladenine synthase